MLSLYQNGFRDGRWGWISVGKERFLEQKSPQYDPVNRECRGFTFVQKTDVKDNFHRILFFPFLLFFSKSEMFWLPKLPTSTSGDFPKSCTSSYKTCVFLKRTGYALLSSAVVAGVGLHLWRFPSHVAFAALDLGLSTCRETWKMGCICNGRKLPKINPNGHAMIITFFHGWLKE